MDKIVVEKKKLTKVCNRKDCEHEGRPQDLDNFYSNSYSFDGLVKECKSCATKNAALRYNVKKAGKTIKKYKEKLEPDFFIKKRFHSMISSAKSRAYKKDMDFDLTLEWLQDIFIKQNKKCLMTGLSFDIDIDKVENVQRNPFVPSIDRIDSNKGYTKDNCRLVCLWVNTALNEWGEELAELMMREYIKNIDSKKEIKND